MSFSTTAEQLSELSDFLDKNPKGSPAYKKWAKAVNDDRDRLIKDLKEERKKTITVWVSVFDDNKIFYYKNALAVFDSMGWAKKKIKEYYPYPLKPKIKKATLIID